MKRNRLLLMVVVFALQVGLAQAGPVVTIWAYHSQGTSLGTGFFTSRDGQILTCYHVIDGATSIEVFNDQIGGTTDVIVEAIAPDRDLAFLRIRKLKKPVAFLTLLDPVAPGIFDEELFMYGHAAGITDQRFVARLTRKPFVRSSEVRDPTTNKPLMALDDVQLLTLQSEGFKGISGGPLVTSQGGVIGVVSGSISMGGSIIWAIPAKYARVELMDPVNKPLSEIKSWKNLSQRRFLLLGGANQLRRLVPVSNALSAAVDDYFRAVDDLDRELADIPVLGLRAQGHAQAFRLVLESLPAGRLEQDVNSLQDPILRETFMELENDVQEATAAQQAWYASLFHVMQRGAEVDEEYRAFIATLPKTQSNLTMEARCDAEIEKVGTDFDKFLTESGFTDFAEKFAGQQKDMMNAAMNLKTGQDMLRLVTMTETLLASLSAPETVRAMGVAVSYCRRLGRAVEALSYLEVEN